MFCTALFSGHGYDQAFTAKMGLILEKLEAGETIVLLTAEDEVCAACPNRLKKGGCALGTEDVLRRDLAALRVLKLSQGETLDWKESRKRLSRLMETEFQEVCGNCRWQKDGLCSFSLLQESVRRKA